MGYMREIYRGCTVDLLWLGEEKGESGFEKAVQIMELFAKADIPALGWRLYVGTKTVVEGGNEEEREQKTWSMEPHDVNHKIPFSHSLLSPGAQKIHIR